MSILHRLAESTDLDIEARIKIALEEGLALHRAKPQLHRFLYSEAPRPPMLQETLGNFDALLEEIVCRHLIEQNMQETEAKLRSALVTRAGQALLHEFVLDESLPKDFDSRLDALHETLCLLLNAQA